LVRGGEGLYGTGALGGGVEEKTMAPTGINAHLDYKIKEARKRVELYGGCNKGVRWVEQFYEVGILLHPRGVIRGLRHGSECEKNKDTGI